MANERAVVVGAGGISNAWLPPLKEENVDIAGLVDLDVKRATAQAAKYELDTPVSDDLAGMLADVRPDFVVDLTVPEAHCEVTCTALQAGCHVIGEKPMASSIEEARRMVRTSEATGNLYMVSQNRRWNPKHQMVRDTVASGEIGTVTTVNCDFYLGIHFGGFREEMESPLILDMAIHHFDLARFLAGLSPVAVYAKEFNPRGSWYRGDVAASCIFEMENNVVFTYRGSWCAIGCGTSWNGNWRIIGDNGTLLYENDSDPTGEKIDGQNAPVSVAPPTLAHEGMHGALRDMLDFLRTGRTPQTECHDNIKSLAMVFGAMASARKQARIELAE